MTNILRYIYAFSRMILQKIRFLGKPIYIHPTTLIPLTTKIETSGGGSVKIGKKCLIFDYVVFWPFGGDIEIGDYCSINTFSVIYGHGGLKIGNYVRIAAHTVIIPANKIFNDKEKPIYLQGETMKGIIIEDDVWIGAGCRILDGVVIGKGSVVGAGSVVTKSIPEYSVVAGVPATIKHQRGEKQRME